MPFDFSASFVYTGSIQTWTKPMNVSTAIFEVYGGGGGGSASASGGGGAFVFAKYINFNPDVSYNVTIDVGSGGKAPPLLTGGISVGGNPANSYGGDGATSAGLSSGGGGGMTNIIYDDPSNNRIIKIIAGGGGGAGSGGGGGASSQIGTTGSGLGGGQGGNTALTGNAGLGGISGGVNGHNYLDSSGTYLFIGGGGGGGSFAGGGGGAGYGGGAGGNKGGGGGGGSYAGGFSISFTSGGGGAGGLPNQNGGNGHVLILYNNVSPVINYPIVPSFMLNAQHTSRSTYIAPYATPLSVNSYQLTLNPVAAMVIPKMPVINAFGDIYIITYGITYGGILKALSADFTLKWNFELPSGNYIQYLPSISISGAIIILGYNNSTYNYTLYSLIDNGITAGIVWTYPFFTGTSVSPFTLDPSGNIYIGNNNFIQYISAQGTLIWTSITYGGGFISEPPALNSENNKLCYTSFSDPYSYVTVINLNGLTSPTLSWINTYNGIFSLTAASTDDNAVYFCNFQSVYALDIDNGNPLWGTTPLTISDDVLSAVAIGSNDRIYFTSRNALNVVDSSVGTLIWSYPFFHDPMSIVNSLPIIDADKNVYFGGGTKLYSVDGQAAAATLNWSHDFGVGFSSGMPVIGNNGNIYVTAQDGYIYDFSGNDPTPPPPAPMPPIVSMYMLNSHHTGLSTYYGPTTTIAPSIQWQAPFVSGNLFVSPSISMDGNGILYLGSNDGNVYALDSSNNGLVKWQKDISNASISPIYTTPAISPDGSTIYVGSSEGYMYALDQLAGNIEWSYKADSPIQSSPTVDASGNIYFGAGKKMYELNSLGSTIWSPPYTSGGVINSSPAVYDNGLVKQLIFGSDDGFIRSIKTGVLFWTTDINIPATLTRPVYSSVSIDTVSLTVFVGIGSSMDGVLYCLNLATGIMQWTFPPLPLAPPAKSGPFYNTVALKGDTIYLSTIAHVYALDKSTGLEKWIKPYTNLNCYYTSPIIDASGTIFFASIQAKDNPIKGYLKNDGILHSLTDNGSSYTENWTIDVCPGGGRLAPPVLDNKRTIYISSTANKIYAII